MSTKRRLVALFDRRLARRLIIVPLALLAALLALVLSPLIVTVAAVRDLIGRRKRWPRLRLALLIIGALLVEAASMVCAFVAWIITGFGFLGPDRWRWHLHRAFMGLYTRTMLGLIARVLGTSIEWRDHADLATGPLVLIARHTSFFDALIPATVLSWRNKLLAHHVVTHGLRYAPCIDVVGHRFPNRFIRRAPGEGSSELVHISAIGGVLDHRSAAIIFPEGTFRNPERFERTLRRIRRRDPDLAEQASELRHVLPPRASGTQALLSGAPTADLVICTNTGLEAFGSIKDIIDRPFSDVPIIIETWRIPRSEIPPEPDAFNKWLFDQYLVIEEWVATHQTTTNAQVQST